MIIAGYILGFFMLLIFLMAFLGIFRTDTYDDVAETKAYDEWLIKEYGQEWFDENVGNNLKNNE